MNNYLYIMLQKLRVSNEEIWHLAEAQKKRKDKLKRVRKIHSHYPVTPLQDWATQHGERQLPLGRRQRKGVQDFSEESSAVTPVTRPFP